MLKQFFAASDGTGSAIRLIMFIVVIAFLGNWTVFNFKAGSMQPFPVDALIAILGAMAIKTAQKALEK